MLTDDLTKNHQKSFSLDILSESIFKRLKINNNRFKTSTDGHFSWFIWFILSLRQNKRAKKIISIALDADDFNIHFSPTAWFFFSPATRLLLSEGNFIMIQWHFSLFSVFARAVTRQDFIRALSSQWKVKMRGKAAGKRKLSIFKVIWRRRKNQ